jgi:phosphate:Na+ symporter
MYKKILYPLFLLIIAYILFASSDAKTIISGIAIFLIGMVFMEDGFKLFSGGILEKVLASSTKTVPRAIGTGFLATSVVQSSSLITVIVISFLSAELMSLAGAIGVVFGSNIGTTTTAWIVSSFGVKIKISVYAMPMLIFGVIFKFNSNKTYQGLGNVLIGLGFVFLGIGYMKEGFDALKSGLDLSQYAMEGYLGVLVFVLIGAVATIVIQSSSATMALIITALVTQQITYLNALELAIGANIGTTVTAVVGSLASNANGKRLAIAHLIFNIITGAVAIIFLYQLADVVDVLSAYVGILSDDYAMKLALFHTIFNVLGVLIVSPFTYKLVKFLEGLFQGEKSDVSKPKYLDEVTVEIPDAAIKALKKEVIHMYENSTEAIAHALSLHRHKFLGHQDISDVVKTSTKNIEINIDQHYETRIKTLYNEIIKFATISQIKMNEDEQERSYRLKLASKYIVEAVKDTKDIHQSIADKLNTKNQYVLDEYNFIREMVAKTLNDIYALSKKHDDIEVLSKIEVLKENIEELNIISNGRIDNLIRENKIEVGIATSLINDSSFAYDISKRLIEVATILWIEDTDIQNLGSDI